MIGIADPEVFTFFLDKEHDFGTIISIVITDLGAHAKHKKFMDGWRQSITSYKIAMAAQHGTQIVVIKRKKACYIFYDILHEIRHRGLTPIIIPYS